MAQIEKLLEYQQIDSKLLGIEQEAANSKERKEYAQAKSFLNKAAEKLDAMNAKAKELTSLLDELNVKYAEISETLNDFDNVDELVEGGAEISFYKKNVLQLIERLRAIKTEVANLSKAIKDSDTEYKNLKKKTLSVQEQYNTELASKYKAYMEEKKSEMAQINKELEKIAGGIDEEVLKKYKIKRSERIFPIICAVKDGRCSKCGTELSLKGKEEISGGKVIECDGCRRFLYKG